MQKLLELREQQETDIKSAMIEAESSFKTQLNKLQMHPAFRRFLASEKRLIQSEQLLYSIESYIRAQKDSDNLQPYLTKIDEKFETLNTQNKIN